jgi:hypothetical protein
MVKLTEVEDEHFAQEKPMATKNNVLLATDDEDEDYTDTGEQPLLKPVALSMSFCSIPTTHYHHASRSLIQGHPGPLPEDDSSAGIIANMHFHTDKSTKKHYLTIQSNPRIRNLC